MFLFLVDDFNPIEAGLLAEGSPDLYFRAFIAGSPSLAPRRSASPASRLTRGLPEPQPLGRRGFPGDHDPALEIRRVALCPRGRPGPDPLRRVLAAPFIDGIRAAREKIVARSDDDRQDFLRKRGFSKAETGRIIETVLAEEGRPPESVFDFVQGSRP